MFSIIFLALSALLLSVGAQHDCSKVPPAVSPSECCPGSCPKFMTQTLADECGLKVDMTAPCNWGLAGLGGSGGFKGAPPSCAAVQCVLKKNNLLTADKKVDKAAFEKFVGQQFSVEWNPIIAKAVSTCVAETDNPEDCDAGTYIMCVKSTMFMNCPAPIAVQSSDCSSLMTFLNKCPVPPHKKQ